MNASQLAAMRLRNQQLLRSRFSTPGEVIAWMGAVQGQEYAGAKWALALRVGVPPGSKARSDGAVEQVFRAHAFIRTWAMRGTLQLINAADARWMVALVGPKVIAGSARRYRELELDEATLGRGCALLVEALAGGNQLNRGQLMAILEQNGISTTGQRSPYLLSRASLEGLICQVDVVRNNPVYALCADILPAGQPMQGEEALAELAARYLASRGPATLRDFAWWSGLPMSQCRAGWESVRSRFAQERVEGQEYWFAPELEVLMPAEPIAHLLPNYDEFLIAYADRGVSLDRAEHAHIAQGNGLSPTVEVDGRIVGTWKRALQKARVEVAVQLFRSVVHEGLDAIRTAAEAYGTYLGLRAECSGV